MTRWHSIARALAFRIVGAALQVVVIFVVARVAGAHVLGAYLIFTSFTRLAGTGLAFGHPILTLRTIAERDVSGDAAGSNLAFRRATASVLRVSAAACLVAAIPAAVVVALGHFDALTTLTAGAGAVASAVLLLGSNALKARERQETALVAEFSLAPLAVIAWAFARSLSGATPVPRELMIVHTAATVGAVALVYSAWHRHPAAGPSNTPPAAPPLRAPDRPGRSSRRSIASFGLTNVLNVAGQTAPQLILPLVLSVADVGRFASAARIAAAPGILVTGLGGVYSARFAQLWTRGDMPRLRRALRETQIVISALFIPFGIVLVAVPELAAQLLGDDLAGIGPAIRILALGQFVNSITGLAPALLSMAHLEWYVFLSTTSVTLIGLVGTLVGGALYGVVGAASGYAAIVAGRNVLWYIRAHRLLASPQQPQLASDVDAEVTSW